MPLLTRRRFLTLLGLGGAGASLDPDFLAWEPGARAFFDLGAGREWTTLLFRRGNIVEFAEWRRLP